MLYHHGSPSARIEAALFDAAARTAGIRLIAIDRPGIGRSEYRSRWTYGTLDEDVRSLLDGLGIERFGVLGWSGGGPPALATAQAMPDRVERAVVVAAARFGGIGRRLVWRRTDPVKRLAAHTAWRYPGAMDWLVWPLGRIIGTQPERFMDGFAVKLCASDQEVLNDEASRAVIHANLEEAFRQGVQGYAHNLDRLFSRWDFDPSAITQPVTIWRGDQDEMVRADLERALADRLPAADFRLFEGEGQYLLVPRAAELFALFRRGG